MAVSSETEELLYTIQLWRNVTKRKNRTKKRACFLISFIRLLGWFDSLNLDKDYANPLAVFASKNLRFAENANDYFLKFLTLE